MYKGIRLAPSLMCIDWLHAGEDLEWLESKGIFDYLHVDLVDGLFAHDFTMGSSIINDCVSTSSLEIDIHLMVEEPRRLFETYLSLDKSTDVLVIHQECCKNLHRDLVWLRQHGVKPGVAICPATPLVVLDYVLQEVARVNIMTVNPGFKGGKLVGQCIQKVRELKSLKDRLNLDVEIAVDGNVFGENVVEMVAAGADTLVLGSSGLFRSDIGKDKALESLMADIDNGLKRRGDA